MFLPRAANGVKVTLKMFRRLDRRQGAGYHGAMPTAHSAALAHSYRVMLDRAGLKVAAAEQRLGLHAGALNRHIGHGADREVTLDTMIRVFRAVGRPITMADVLEVGLAAADPQVGDGYDLGQLAADLTEEGWFSVDDAERIAAALARSPSIMAACRFGRSQVLTVAKALLEEG